MSRYLILFLVLSSFLSCSPLKDFSVSDKNDLAFVDAVLPLSSSNSQVIYKAQIDIYSKHFSGLVVIKKVERDTAIRIVFMSEMGVSFFDFEYKNNLFEVKSTMPGFDNKMIINTFQEDFRLLLINSLHGNNVEVYENEKQSNTFAVKSEFDDLRHFYYFTDSVPVKVLSKKKIRNKRICIVEKSEGVFPDKIELQHKGVRLKIVLSKIN